MQTDDEADASVHRDIDADIALAGAVEGVDVLIGGHADAGQEEPFIHPVTGTLICQTYGQGTRLGYLKLLIDPESGEIVGHDGRLLVVASDELAPQPMVAAKLAAYRARFPEVDEIIGRTAERLTRRYNEESISATSSPTSFATTGRPTSPLSTRAASAPISRPARSPARTSSTPSRSSTSSPPCG